MPQSEEQVCQAVLSFVTEGAYPEEKVVAAEFPTTALARELELIARATEQVEVRQRPRWTPLWWSVLTDSFLE